jgi:hypothetical protein
MIENGSRHSSDFVETSVPGCYEQSTEVLLPYKTRNFLTVVSATAVEA